MSDISSVKDKEPLIIEGTLTGQTDGTWTGNYLDVFSAFGNKPVYFKIIAPSGDMFSIPIVQINNLTAYSCLLGFGASSAIGVVYPDNTFSIDFV